MEQRRLRVRAALLAAVSLCSALAITGGIGTLSPASAADGDLDPTFGTGGVTTIAFPAPNSAPVDVGFALAALAPDGRVVVAAQVSGDGDSAGQYIGMQRLTSAGVVDPTFSGAPIKGIAGLSTPRGVEVLPDGRIVVLGMRPGMEGPDCVVARLLPTGALDTTFSSDGLSPFNIYGNDWCETMAVMPNGSVIVAGDANGFTTSGHMLVKLTPAGGLDSAFGGDGRVEYLQGTVDTTRVTVDLAIDASGRISVMMQKNVEGTFEIRRFLSPGSVDTTWNGGAELLVADLGTGRGASAIDAAGRLVVAVGASSGGPNIRRFAPSGAIDTSFNGGSSVVLANGSNGVVALVVQTDNRIVVAGGEGGVNGVGARMQLARLTSTGHLDASFGGGGVVIEPVGGHDLVFSLARASDGTILAGGTTTAGAPAVDRAFVARFSAGTGVPTPATTTTTVPVTTTTTPPPSPPPSTAPPPAPPSTSGPCFSQSFVDPAVGGHPDISDTSMHFDCGSQQGTFGLTTYLEFDDSQLDELDLLIDADRSVFTGCGGYDAVIASGYDPAGGTLSAVALRTPSCDPFSWTESGVVQIARTNGSRRIELRFPHSAIGSPSSFSWASVLFMNGVEEPDFEPDGADHVVTVPVTNVPPLNPPGNPGPGVSRATGTGYWMLDALGSVYGFGPGAQFYGSAMGQLGEALAIDIEPTPTGRGYWILDDFGSVYDFGDAPWFGDILDVSFADEEYASSISRTPSGNGYWIFTNLGRAFAFGDALRLGDLSQTRLNGEILGSVATPSGRGYYMVGSDGGIFAFGDARFFGSMGSARLNAPVMSMVPTASGAGYWLVAEDGGIFAYGDAGFVGSIPGVLAPGQKLNQPITGMVRYGNGYLMVAADGGIFSFSNQPFHGSLGGVPIVAPIFSVAVAPGAVSPAVATAGDPGAGTAGGTPASTYPSRWVATGVRTLSA